MKKGDIRIHKKLNLMPISFGKETLINTFYGLIKTFNNLNEPQTSIEVTKSDLWKLGGLKGEYNSEYIRELIKEITKSETFKVSENHEINGPVFVTERIGEKYKIYVTEPYWKFIFTRKDLAIMTKARNKEKMAVNELDYWDNTLKNKSKELVLLKEADLLGIKGKYSKRLYSLLGQFDHAGKYWTSMEKFRKLLEIPESYKMANIDQRVIEKAKEQLKEKAGIEITDVKKIKKGRKIAKIEFYFEYTEKGEQLKEDLKTKEIEIEPEHTTMETRGSLNREVEEFKEELLKIGEKQVGNLAKPFKKALDRASTIEDLNDIATTFNINRSLRF